MATESLLRYMVGALVAHPEAVQIRSTGGGRGGVQWELRVSPEDFPRVIGRGGRTARALRAVVEASDRGPVRAELNIMDPEDDGTPV
ncbi:MAG: KH domain-containing protein [Terriglobales bacterium]